MKTDWISNQLIGFNGSLSESIEDIKSTLLYPGKKPVNLIVRGKWYR